jgi:hypothetical protein
MFVKAYFGYTYLSNSKTDNNILHSLPFKISQLYALSVFALNYFYKDKDNK